VRRSPQPLLAHDDSGRRNGAIELARPGAASWLNLIMVAGDDEREADLEQRENAVTAREEALAERMDAAKVVLDAAEERDTDADARDGVADRRESDLDLAQLLTTDDKHGYGGDWAERRNANLDRVHAKDDRKASHDDRIALTEDNSEHGTDET
jgi:hypothetical protein